MNYQELSSKIKTKQQEYFAVQNELEKLKKEFVPVFLAEFLKRYPHIKSYEFGFSQEAEYDDEGGYSDSQYAYLQYIETVEGRIHADEVDEDSLAYDFATDIQDAFYDQVDYTWAGIFGNTADVVVDRNGISKC